MALEMLFGSKKDLVTYMQLGCTDLAAPTWLHRLLLLESEPFWLAIPNQVEQWAKCCSSKIFGSQSQTAPTASWFTLYGDLIHSCPFQSKVESIANHVTKDKWWHVQGQMPKIAKKGQVELRLIFFWLVSRNWIKFSVQLLCGRWPYMRPASLVHHTVF